MTLAGANEDKGERQRIAHALDRMEAMVASMRLALTIEAPLGQDSTQALVVTAGEVTHHAAAADAYRRAAAQERRRP